MNNGKKLLTWVFIILLLCLPLVAWKNSQAIQDWWLLRGYDPPAAITSLAKKDKMTDSARHIFYVNHPDLEKSLNDFHNSCPNSEQTIVLGCYHGGQGGIFIYDVSDKRLDGVQEVTAAHEMLHAAYDRLSTKERGNIDNQLEDYYKHDLKDKRIIDTINLYKKTEPNDLINEMHSIFGTEIAKLPSGLETYYERYFTNRAAVVKYANGYEQEFTSRLDRIQEYDNQLADLKLSINAQEAALASQSAQIQTDRARLDQLRSNKNYAEYNAGVSSFNSEVESYNAVVSKLKGDISFYNQLVKTRNDIASEVRSLNSSIDTTLTTQKEQ